MSAEPIGGARPSINYVHKLRGVHKIIRPLLDAADTETGTHDPSTTSFAAIPRGAVRSANRSDGHRSALYVRARRLDVNSPPSSEREPIGVRRASWLFEISWPRSRRGGSPALRHACLYRFSDRGRARDIRRIRALRGNALGASRRTPSIPWGPSISARGFASRPQGRAGGSRRHGSWGSHFSRDDRLLA